MAKLSVPSKTFLVGEYIVLQGGPAILLSTPPCFEVITENNQFIDPYLGLGGFGASSAKFVLAEKAKGHDDPWGIWRSYRESGLLGSGADVVAQIVGGIVFFHANKNIIEKLSWPFNDLAVALIHTGKKLLTHDHLANLTLQNSAIIALDQFVIAAYQAIKTGNHSHLLQSINHYADKLLDLGFVAEHTQQLLQTLQAREDVLACKGCGAMGSDVVLAIIPTQQQQEFVAWAVKEQLHLVFCGNGFYESH
jgi:mevalonate kinase